MAHKKGGGSSRNGRDSRGQRLGVKKFGNESVNNGNILVRQHGTKVKPGKNVRLGRDYTLYSTIHGKVFFETLPGGQKRISVLPVNAGAVNNES